MVDAGGAERLGARLLGEVEESALGELLASLHSLLNPLEERKIFNIPELDALLAAQHPVQPQLQQHHHQRSDDDTWDPRPETPRHQNDTYRISTDAKKNLPTVVELVSPPHAHHPSPAGKTALLHLLTTTAILPASLSTVPLSGLSSTIILFDPLSHFSVPFLATTLFSHIASRFTQAGKPTTSPAAQREITHCVQHALSHVHIFRPASWESLNETLHSLETYLFDARRHASSRRRVHAIVLDDVDAFVPALRTSQSALPAASVRLTGTLASLAARFSCAVVTAGRASSASPLRVVFPLSWPPEVQRVRLGVRRVQVLRFAPGMSIAEAEAERAQRWEVVRKGRFEAWRIGERDGQNVVFCVGQGAGVSAVVEGG